MRTLISCMALFAVALFGTVLVQAQNTGSIAGTVVDANGAVVPGASVEVTGQAGQRYNATTNSSGSYQIPNVGAGFYTVHVTAPNFKTIIIQNVKVDVATPATVNVLLEPGAVTEEVIVTGGQEVLQSQTPTIGSTITGRQITETPITSRDALDLVTLLPGVSTTGAPRRSTINGLPKGSISITIDGVDVQDNYLRSSDGFFTYVRPRVDAIDEVTVTTAVPGAEVAGDGAVGIRFVTRRGTNKYTGGGFWQHRNDALNANYWFSNRDGLERQKMRLNQFGGRLGGPIPFPNFGDSGGPFFNSGKDRAFFFVSYEEFRYPEAQARSRTVLTPAAMAGEFSYVVGSQGETQTVNVFNIAAAHGGGLPTTIDPTIGGLLNRIQSATSGGTLLPIQNNQGIVTDPNRMSFRFNNPGNQKRTFLALRFDVNITKNHSIENITNHQKFDSMPDFLNSMDPLFPGYTGFSQKSTRNSNSTALRSSFTSNLINEVRFAYGWGASAFAPELSPDYFTDQGGFNVNFGGALGVTGATIRNSKSGRSSPTKDFTNNLTWINGKHTIGIGGQFKRIGFSDYATNFTAPTVYFGIASTTDPVAYAAFENAVMPGASAATRNAARAFYAGLVGRISQVDFWAEQTLAGEYAVGQETGNKVRQDSYGLYVQDTWRIRNNLSFNVGVRWQPQTSYVALSRNYGRVGEFADIWGISGLNNHFKPGTMTGRDPIIVRVEEGEAANETDFNNFAPSIGFTYSPNFDGGVLGSFFGGPGKSVIRGGFSRAFVREGTLLLLNLLGSNPGGSRIDLRRHSSFGNIVSATNLRDPNNPNLVPGTYPDSPQFPYSVTQNIGINAFDPNLKTGFVDSWSAGYQRELDRNTVLELRYVGTRGRDLWVQHNFNELNTIENGFADEFLLARQNLLANVAARRCQGNFQSTDPQGANYLANCHVNFAYFGEGTGTHQLPIFIAHMIAPTVSGGVTTPSNPALVANYASAFFRSSAASFNPFVSSVQGIAATLENTAGNRARAIANGLPANFFYANPMSGSGGAYILTNNEKSWYDAAVVEVRRRMSAGLRLSASYTFAKAFTNAYATSAGNDQVNYVGITLRDPGLQKASAQHDLRHAFKFDATYDLPFGRGGKFFSNANGFVNGIIGGWGIAPVIRWQSGSPFAFQNVQLVGMTREELQKEIKVRKGAGAVTFLPDDIILNTQRAFAYDLSFESGYATTYGAIDPNDSTRGGIAPTGRYIAPAGTGNCIARYAGECGFANLVLQGPSYFKLDVSLMKKVYFTETFNIELRAAFYDALNAPNFRVGSWGADTVIVGAGGSGFGQLGNTSAFQDVSTTNDPGGRIVEFNFRINF